MLGGSIHFEKTAEVEDFDRPEKPGGGLPPVTPSGDPGVARLTPPGVRGTNHFFEHELVPVRRVSCAVGAGVVLHRNGKAHEVQLHLSDGPAGLLAALTLSEAERIAYRVLQMVALARAVGSCPEGVAA